MNVFYEFCYNSLQRKTPQRAAAPKKRPDTPEPFVSKELRRIDCRNFACIHDTNDVSKWKKVNYNKHFFYFCSEDCWNQWLQEPATMGCWSPSFEPGAEAAGAEAAGAPPFSLDD